MCEAVLAGVSRHPARVLGRIDELDILGEVEIEFHETSAGRPHAHPPTGRGLEHRGGLLERESGRRASDSETPRRYLTVQGDAASARSDPRHAPAIVRAG